MNATTGEPLLSVDELVKVFRAGEDPHTAVAAEILDKLPEDVTTADRKIGKNTNFGMCYGMQANYLAEKMNMPVKRAQQFHDNFFAVTMQRSDNFFDMIFFNILL